MIFLFLMVLKQVQSAQTFFKTLSVTFSPILPMVKVRREDGKTKILFLTPIWSFHTILRLVPSLSLKNHVMKRRFEMMKISLRSKRFQRARSELLFRPRDIRASAKIRKKLFFALALFSRGRKNEFASRPLGTLGTQAR